jgi:hypothetical protein
MYALGEEYRLKVIENRMPKKDVPGLRRKK